MASRLHVLRRTLMLALGMLLVLTPDAIVLGQAVPAVPLPAESLLIAPGDLLHVTVFREMDLEQRVRVKDSGEVALQLVGDVPVRGLAPAEAAGRIAQRYREGGFLNYPQVAVFVDESTTQQVAVLGEVGRPGTVPLTSPRSLIDVISEAGGLTQFADRHITIRHDGQPPRNVFLSNHADKALADADVLVQPGETVLVPKAGIVYVLGDVGRPGAFSMQNEARLSLLEALTLAGGANKTAAEGRTRLLRKVSGTVIEQPLALPSIERGKQPDLDLQADDVVYIPFSMVKNVALGATSILAAASSAAVYVAH